MADCRCGCREQDPLCIELETMQLFALALGSVGVTWVVNQLKLLFMLPFANCHALGLVDGDGFSYMKGDASH